MGSIKDLAIANAREILNGGFSDELTIKPKNLDPVTINGLTTRHSQGFDSEGLPTIGDNAHCSFSEKDLNDLGITTRDAKGNLNIKDWKVSFPDAISVSDYRISETMPDNTLGLIRVILSII